MEYLFSVQCVCSLEPIPAQRGRFAVQTLSSEGLNATSAGDSHVPLLSPRADVRCVYLCTISLLGLKYYYCLNLATRMH